MHGVVSDYFGAREFLLAGRMLGPDLLLLRQRGGEEREIQREAHTVQSALGQLPQLGRVLRYDRHRQEGLPVFPRLGLSYRAEHHE